MTSPSMPFESFVIFAEMRTGSNFLESNLNALPGVHSFGEAFNPVFIGTPTTTDILGIDQVARDADPMALLQAIRGSDGGLGGFRYFHDHDPRVLVAILDDPRCAKIVLTRNPLDSYVSRKIAQATGQWKLTNVTKRKEAQARFEPDEFETHLADLQAFQLRVQHHLQVTGQSAFYIGYEDLNDLEVLNGLAKWLGVAGRLEALRTNLKRQNPDALLDKVANPGDLQDGLARLDRFNLTRTPGFEPRRGPAVPGFVAGAQAPLLYMPIRSGPEGIVARWLADLDQVDRKALRRNFTQRSLRDWMAAHPHHRSFTVLRHPLARAHMVFCRHILPQQPGPMGRVRRILGRTHGLDLPEDPASPSYDLVAHHAAFLGFLRFIKANLSGQTVLGVDAHWASQAQCLQGMAEFALPDVILREDDLTRDLPDLAARVGARTDVLPASAPRAQPFDLAQVYSAELEQAARAAYARDYILFGFGDWAGQAA